MTTDPASTGMRNVALSEEEANELLQLLESSLGETRVEVHHTHTPGFRENLQRREAVLRSVIGKLRQERP